MPQIAMRVAEIAAKADVAPSDLVVVIETDPAVTAKVLKLCNSAFYGFSREIGALSEASNMLGVTTLVNLVVTSCSSKVFKSNGQSQQQSSQNLWEDSVLSAMAASRVAKANGHVDASRAYTAGLLQNVGMIVIDRFLRTDIPRVQVEMENGKSLLDAEEAVFGMHHAEIGARLAEQWYLPRILDRHLAGVAHLSEMIAVAFSAPGGLAENAQSCDEYSLSRAGLDRKKFDSIQALLTADLEKARDFLSAA
jgi:HD-like signal output (HDOD) protein